MQEQRNARDRGIIRETRCIENAGGKGVAKWYKEGVHNEEITEHLKNAKRWKKTK